jgi:hypothetical protein
VNSAVIILAPRATPRGLTATELELPQVAMVPQQGSDHETHCESASRNKSVLAKRPTDGLGSDMRGDLTARGSCRWLVPTLS